METGPQNPWPGEIPISNQPQVQCRSSGQKRGVQDTRLFYVKSITLQATSSPGPGPATTQQPVRGISTSFSVPKIRSKTGVQVLGCLFSENPFFKGGQKLKRQCYMHTLHSDCEVEGHHQQFSHQTKHTAGCIINPRAFHATFFRPNDLSMTRNRLKNVFLITGKAGPSPPANTPLREGNLTFLPNGRKSLTGFT